MHLAPEQGVRVVQSTTLEGHDDHPDIRNPRTTRVDTPRRLDAAPARAACAGGGRVSRPGLLPRWPERTVELERDHDQARGEGRFPVRRLRDDLRAALERVRRWLGAGDRRSPHRHRGSRVGRRRFAPRSKAATDAGRLAAEPGGQVAAAGASDQRAPGRPPLSGDGLQGHRARPPAPVGVPLRRSPGRSRAAPRSSGRHSQQPGMPAPGAAVSRSRHRDARRRTPVRTSHPARVRLEAGRGWPSRRPASPA